MSSRRVVHHGGLPSTGNTPSSNEINNSSSNSSNSSNSFVNVVNVNNVNKFRGVGGGNLESLIGCRVPVEVKAWLSELASRHGETISSVVRKILVAAFHGSVGAGAVEGYAPPTVIVNFVSTASVVGVGVGESRGRSINASEYLAAKALGRVYRGVREVYEAFSSGRLRCDCDGDCRRVQARVERLREELERSLKAAKSIPGDWVERVDWMFNALDEVERRLSDVKRLR